MTKKQEETIAAFLSKLEGDTDQAYQEIITCLTALGYRPAKEKSNISFKHDLHNKQIAKIGIRKGDAPFFALRFSACKEYSSRIADIIAAYAEKYPAREARCVRGECQYCKGEPGSHVYEIPLPGGGRKTYCGAYAVEITGFALENAAEIKTLIGEEHQYLLKQEAGIG